MMLRKLGNKLLVRISGALLAVAVLTIPNSLEASILLPEQTSHDFEQMLAAKKFSPRTSTSSSSTSSSSMSSNALSSSRVNHRTNDLPKDSERASQQFFLPLQTFFGGSSQGPSSSTSSTGGNVGTDSLPSHSSASCTHFDTEHVAWVCGERHSSLPSPLVNDLLRPPQA